MNSSLTLTPSARGCAKPDVVRIARMATANEARLRSHKAQVGFIAAAFGFG